ncbi:MAG: uracil-DNA glycosylase [Propionibacteriales bacterium]|nr:uracil-DNA glycosylase [Propionibacteriales bacterium]
MNLPHPLTRQLFPSPVPPGSGWPGDPAKPSSPRAADADDVRRLAGAASSLDELAAEISVCRACPRLVDWRETVAVAKRKSFSDQPYWGRPIMGWGSGTPAVLIVGLAPAAHGGNRSGRIFTGDRSGDWLFGSLHRTGLAAQPTSEHAGDGQALIGARLVAAVRCAPPDNKPTPPERDTCAPWLDAELSRVLSSVRVIVCLGSYGWDSLLRALARLGLEVPRPRPRFGHGAQFSVPRRGVSDLAVLGCFHPSQQNTFTGKLTEPMLDAVLGKAARLSRTDGPGSLL